MWWPQFLISFGFVFFVEDGFRPNWWTEPRIRLKCGKRQVQLLPEYFTKLKELTSKNLNFHQAPGFCGILCFLNAPKSWLMEGRKTISCMCFFFIVFFVSCLLEGNLNPEFHEAAFLVLARYRILQVHEKGAAFGTEEDGKTREVFRLLGSTTTCRWWKSRCHPSSSFPILERLVVWTYRSFCISIEAWLLKSTAKNPKTLWLSMGS